MNSSTITTDQAVHVLPQFNDHCPGLLTDDALAFLTELHHRFDDERIKLLQARKKFAARIAGGEVPRFAENTRHIRSGRWQVAPIPADLQDRRVEITGPVDRKMVINALNSGARVFMADFEDSSSPTAQNMASGQQNLYDAVRRTIGMTATNGKQYKLNNQVATLMVRPRGLHLTERHILVNGQPMSGSLVDFGLFFFHNAHELISRGSGPYFYLPKLEHYREARWWNEVFIFAQHHLGVRVGTIKATVLVETLPAVFQLDEILYELRDHSAGLNCGRWDYIFSYIKTFSQHQGRILPDRDQVTMEVPFMEAYAKKVVRVCHRRGVHAMGGMAAQIPIKNDEEANATAFEKVRRDKMREVKAGHDGTWVAHPGMVQLATDVFDAHMPEPNQIDYRPEDGRPNAEQLLATPAGTITEAGVRKNIFVGVQYLAAWLSGYGAAAIHHLMEDAATAEISRAQLWQWLRYRVEMADGRTLNEDLFETFFAEERERLLSETPAQWAGRLDQAAHLFHGLVKRETLADFLTTEAYPLLKN